MERKNYSKPFMYTERFTPQEFVAACTLINISALQPARKETNGIPGCQQTQVNATIEPWKEYEEEARNAGATFTQPHSSTLMIHEDQVLGNQQVLIQVAEGPIPYASLSEDERALWNGNSFTNWYKWITVDNDIYYTQHNGTPNGAEKTQS